MAITVHTQISIVMAEAATEPKPPIGKPNHYRIVRVQELPGGETTAWALSVSERIIGQEAQWEARLSFNESQRLVALLEQAPPRSMTLENGIISCGGIEYEMLIERAEHSHPFRWRNDDWLCTLGGPKEMWSQVSAIAGHVMQVVERTRPADEPGRLG